MKTFFRKKITWLSAAVILLILCAGIPKTMAYFTTYVKAQGGYPVILGNTTTVTEEVKDMTKHITLENTGKTACYVRVKVFAGSQFALSFSGDLAEDGSPLWKSQSDGYWYYQKILPSGEKSSTLLAKIEVPEDFQDSFNVIVVQECTEVLYDADGTAYADWNRLADSNTDVKEVSGEEAGK